VFNIKRVVKILNKKYKIENEDLEIVAGSGLKDAVPNFDGETISVNYSDLGLPKSKVKGHSGKFVFGKINGVKVVVVSRMHFYESGDINKVKLPFSIVSQLGAKKIILLTSSGGVNSSFKVGDIMIIKDHINLSGIVPTVGMEEIEFTDMSDCYSKQFISEIKEIAKSEDIDLREGVHVQMSGPNYETKAEVEMIRKLCGDSVSMSTAHDCIISKYYKMNVLGFAVIVNVFNNSQDELTHEEVLENASKACDKIKKLLINFISK